MHSMPVEIWSEEDARSMIPTRTTPDALHDEMPERSTLIVHQVW